MANIKDIPEIEIIHNAWCRENGYPVRWCKPQAGRPKHQATSFKHRSHKRQATSNKLNRFVKDHHKPQASSNKPQAPGHKAQASSHKQQAPGFVSPHKV